MPVNAATAPTAPTDLAWRVIGLLNLYRLLVPLVLITVQALAGHVEHIVDRLAGCLKNTVGVIFRIIVKNRKCIFPRVD